MIRSCPQVRKVATQFFICYLKGKLLDEICNKYTIRNTKTVIVSKTRQTVFKIPQRSTLTCVCVCACICVAYASRLTHSILYQSSHLTAALVAPRQSADVTVIV